MTVFVQMSHVVGFVGFRSSSTSLTANEEHDHGDEGRGEYGTNDGEHQDLGTNTQIVFLNREILIKQYK